MIDLVQRFMNPYRISGTLDGAGGLEGRGRPSRGLQRNNGTRRSVVVERHRGGSPCGSSAFHKAIRTCEMQYSVPALRWIIVVSLIAGMCLCCAQADGGEPDWGAVSAGVKSSALQKHIETLASFGSRIPGYSGHDKALDYIRKEFQRLGYARIEEDVFPVTVPVDEGTSLEVLGSGRRFTIHALWPNLVRTSQLPPEGITGTALPGKGGDWKDFNGKTIKDAVVFMDFNSGSNWLNAAMLGARAVVFVEPDRTVRRQAEAKLANVPLNMPRFWISNKDFQHFQSAGMGKQVRLKCGMQWRKVEARNLLVWMEGTDPSRRDTLVCIQAYYDSMSVVPAVAPGAEAACGMAAMLEIARVLKAHPPKCSVLFLATSGHYLAHAGITAFLQEHSRKRSPFEKETEKPIHPALMLCLELSSRNQTIGVTFADGTHGGTPAASLYTREFLRHANRFCAYATELRGVLNREPEDLCLNLVMPERGGSWRPFLPENISLDGTRALFAAMPAITLATVYDPRLAVDTPLDRPADVNLPNLTLQTRFLACALLMGLDDPDLLEAPKMEEDRLRLFRGRLVTFDPSKSFMPSEPVSGGIGRLCKGKLNTTGGLGTHVGVRTELLTLADEDGWFEVVTTFVREVHVEGYQIDPRTGDIIKAVDLGLEGAAQFPVEFMFDTYVKERKAIVLFDCETADLYDLVDPRYLITMDKLSFFDPGNSEPFAYGYCLNAIPPSSRMSESAPYASVFTKPGMHVKLGVSSDILGQRMLFLNAPSAASKKESEGIGYDIGKIRLVENAPYRVLRDMYYLDENRIRVVRKYGIENRRLERLHTAGGEALGLAEAAMKERRWDQFIRHARRGLGIESRAYPDVRATANDVVKGIIFYMALLLPFAFFCERLFFAFPDLKRRLAAFAGFFMLTYMVLRLIHPAFKIVETAEVILLGLVILTLCGIVVFISASRFEAQMRTLKQKRGRVHYADVSRVSATATAFALGVSNMRRRKVRTFLTCTAVVLLMFTVLSFTSVKTYLRPRKLPRANKPTYQGILVRDRTWVPMKYLALEHLAGEFEDAGILARRSWLAPRAISTEFTQLSILLRPMSAEGRRPERVHSFGLVGFDPSEAEVSGLHTTLECGRWFRPGDREVCILPDAIAEALKIGRESVGTAQVHLLGMNLRVVGIVNSEQYDAHKDLDNETLTPLDFTMLSRDALQRTTQAGANVSAVEGRAALETFVHINPRNIVLMPYETVLDLGGTFQSVAVKFHTGTVGEHVERLLDRLAVTVFAGEGDRTAVYSSLASSSIGGMGNILVPLLIAALMILNTMSGSVHERLQEIGTYSSVGLAPSHIGALFLAEACVYAILGAIAGYVIGQVVTKVLSMVGGLSGLTLNYSSLASVMATVVVMVTVIASTLYPAKMASRMAVPDVTRKWVLPDPEGDEWHFDFPFTVSGKEVKGLYVFFSYYFASFEEQSAGRFYTTGTQLARVVEAGETGYCLSMRAWLAPYDLGVSQDVELRAEPTGDFGVYSIRLRLKRLSGQTATWVRINRGFLDEMRKQFLLWRTISPEMKAEYCEEAEGAFAQTEKGLDGREA